MPIDFTPKAKSIPDKSNNKNIGFTPEKEQINFTPREKIDFKEFGVAKLDPSKMSPLQKTLDIFNRPGAAFRSGLLQVQKENQELFKDIPEWDTIGRMKAQAEHKVNIQERFKALQSGLSGQERVTGNQLWEGTGVSRVPGLGFATEVATDPLMYGGYSVINKVMGKGLQLTGKGAMKIPAFARTVKKVGEVSQPMVSRTKELFLNKSGIPELAKLIDKHLLKREYLKGRELKFGLKTRNVIQNISRKTGQSIDDVEKLVVNLIEQPLILPKGTSPEAITLANTLRSHLTNMLTTELKAGVPITSLAGGARNIMYFPRITTKEAMKYLKQAHIGNKKIWNVKLQNALQRRTGDFTLQEFNDFVASHGLKSLGGRSLEQFFLQKPSIAIAIRGARSAKAVTSAQFLDDVGRQFGSKTAPSWHQELPDAVTRFNKTLKGLKFDPEVASEVVRTSQAYINPQQLGTFRQGFDAVQNLWKRWTLAPFPKYHLRNMVGNLWNNHLADVKMSNYPKAQALQMYRRYKGKGGTLERTALLQLRKFGISTDKADDIIRNAEELGVLGRGWFGGDIETTMERQLKGGFLRHLLRTKIKKVATGEVLIEKGMAFGTTVENNARLAHFIDKVDKGYDAMSASISVKKFLFDYGDLTQFEREIMKRAFPFYTWTRKNIPLQLEMLWKRPEKFMGLSPMVRNNNPEDLLRLKYVRPNLYERMPVELRRDADTVTYVPLEGLIPAGDLSKMVRPNEMMYELLSPYLRAPLEQIFNKSLYFESEIEKYPEETQELLRMDLPVKLKYNLTTLLPQARLLNEINKIVEKGIRKEKLTPTEQAFSASLSSIYKVNLVDLRNRALRTIESKIKDLEDGMWKAKLYERGKEKIRIKNTYLKIKEEFRRLK